MGCGGNQYISGEKFQGILEELNINITEKGRDGYYDSKSLLERATGDLESDLVERFVVPLVAHNGGAFSSAPDYAKQKVLNAINAKIRQIIGNDLNKNGITIDSTQKFIDVQKTAYEDHRRGLLDPKKLYGLKLQEQAEGAVVPIQTIGLGRADNHTHFTYGHHHHHRDDDL